MRSLFYLTLLSCSSAIWAAPLPAQRLPDPALGEKGDRAAGGAFGAAERGPAVHPLMQAIDLDRDGTLSPREIRGAVKALKKMDRNGDGSLTPDELAAGAAAGRMGRGIDRPGLGRRAAGARGAPVVPPRAGAGVAGRGVARPGVGPQLRGGAVRNNAGRAGGFNRPPGNGLPMQPSKLLGFDKNRDRRLTREELPEQLHPLFTRFDLNRDGAIDLLELRSGGRGR